MATSYGFATMPDDRWPWHSVGLHVRSEAFNIYERKPYDDIMKLSLWDAP